MSQLLAVIDALSSLVQKLLQLNYSLGEVIHTEQRVRFPMRLSAYSIFGEVLMKKSPASPGRQLML